MKEKYLADLEETEPSPRPEVEVLKPPDPESFLIVGGILDHLMYKMG